MSTKVNVWAEISKLLRDARKELSLTADAVTADQAPAGLLTGTLSEFEEFLSHNELELAWEALADVAGRSNAPAAFWHKLARAAALMQLPEKEKDAAGRANILKTIK